MKTKDFITVLKVGAADAVQELGVALQHLDQLGEFPTGTPANQKAEELANAAAALVTVANIALAMSEQCEKAEKALTS